MSPKDLHLQVLEMGFSVQVFCQISQNSIDAILTENQM
ncbi:hypothetical protein SOVF_139090 [Spinacia oleracea]|nr:hypothetical protein SOVF_139090 [Spinacia oleracea]